jgi:hypothetical protein
MLQMSQRSPNPTPNPIPRTPRITHVIPLRIPGLRLGEVVLEAKEGVELETGVRVDGVHAGGLGGVGCNGLVGAAAYYEDWGSRGLW